MTSDNTNISFNFMNNNEQNYDTQIVCVMCKYNIDELDGIFEFNDKLYCNYCHTNNNLYNENDNEDNESESNYETCSDYEYSEDYD